MAVVSRGRSKDNGASPIAHVVGNAAFVLGVGAFISWLRGLDAVGVITVEAVLAAFLVVISWLYLIRHAR
jgi:hypothetical protein